MPRRKERSEDLRSRIVDLHEAGKGYKSISKSLDVHVSTVRQTVYKWRKFTVAALPRRGRPVKMTARAQRRMLNEVKKNPRVSDKDLQKSLAHANIFVDTSTIRKTLNKNGVHGRTPRRKPLLSRKNIAARLKFAKEHLDVAQHYWQNILWTDETKIEWFGKNTQHYVWRKKRHSTPTSKSHPHCKTWRRDHHGLGLPGRTVVIDGKMNSRVYQDILQENVRPSVRQLTLRRGWVMQQDNDPKHTSNSTKEWLRQNKIRLLEWPSQSTDLKPIEMLWHDFKRAIHTRHPKNIATLKQFCEEEWSKITPDRCAGLICNYRKCLVEIIAAKGGSTSY
uniref:Transposase n=1 Tax=Leptobrachium leishanense TaxID=445787 RepID=A0A8C5Q5G5_9ANUR